MADQRLRAIIEMQVKGGQQAKRALGDLADETKSV